MKLFILCVVLFSSSVQSAMYIFQPGKPVRMIQKNSNNTTMLNMGNGEVTQIIDMGGVTAISGGGRPTSFIMDGGELGRSVGGEVAPALDPNTGDVEPEINLRPQGLDVEFEEWQ